MFYQHPNFHEGCSPEDVLILQSLVSKHQTLSSFTLRTRWGKEDEDEGYGTAGRFLYTALFHWIRRDVSGVVSSLVSAAGAYIHSSSSPVTVDHMVRCLRVARHFERDISKQFLLRLRIRDVYNISAARCYSQKATMNDVHIVSYLWRAMEHTFSIWRATEMEGVVDKAMVTSVVENCLILCMCCQNLQQHDDSLSHARRCISFLDEHFPVAMEIPQFLKLIAFAAVLQSRLQPESIDLAEFEVKRAMHGLTDIRAVHSVESAFILDSVCRVLYRKYPNPGEYTAQLIVDFEELAGTLWVSLDPDGDKYLKERAAASVFIADFRAKVSGQIKEALEAYELASALFARGFIFGPWSPAFKRDLEDQRACIDRRIAKLKGKVSGDGSDEPWKLELQEMSLWGLRPHDESVRHADFGSPA